MRPAHGAAPRKASSPEASILSAASAGRGGTCGPSPASARASRRCGARPRPGRGSRPRPACRPGRCRTAERDRRHASAALAGSRSERTSPSRTRLDSACEAPVQDAELEAGPEQGVARRAIALDQEVEIGGLAEREPRGPSPSISTRSARPQPGSSTQRPPRKTRTGRPAQVRIASTRLNPRGARLPGAIATSTEWISSASPVSRSSTACDRRRRRARPRGSRRRARRASSRAWIGKIDAARMLVSEARPVPGPQHRRRRRRRRRSRSWRRAIVPRARRARGADRAPARDDGVDARHRRPRRDVAERHRPAPDRPGRRVGVARKREGVGPGHRGERRLERGPERRHLPAPGLEAVAPAAVLLRLEAPEQRRERLAVRCDPADRQVADHDPGLDVALGQRPGRDAEIGNRRPDGAVGKGPLRRPADTVAQPRPGTGGVEHEVERRARAPVRIGQRRLRPAGIDARDGAPAGELGARALEGAPQHPVQRRPVNRDGMESRIEDA